MQLVPIHLQSGIRVMYAIGQAALFFYGAHDLSTGNSAAHI